MLERLDAVDWAAVEHAYGPATDVPDLLRALRSPDSAARQHARHALFGTIVHQGTRYAATAPAVPFLAELALAPDTPERHRLVWLLTYAAIGYDSASLPAGIVEGTLDQLARTTNTEGDEREYGPGRWPPTRLCRRSCRRCCPSYGYERSDRARFPRRCAPAAAHRRRGP
jgi:hypothetical protein